MFYHGARRYYTSQNSIRYIYVGVINDKIMFKHDILSDVILIILYSIMLVYINLIISITISYSMSLCHTIVSVCCTILLCLY